ncbi:MAG TPA: DUF302 domain-containing protein [Gammaproteobacteria bacterium]|nr:DUF302 domain-containing protein [Gammaproteobacteria bacterium]
MGVYYIVDSDKSVNDAARDLDAAVKKYGFGVLHTYDLKQTLKNKGFELPAECRILEVCNPQQATALLAADMDLNMALPCRISVYEQAGRTKIGTIKPTALLGLLSQKTGLSSVARTVEDAIEKMIDEAAGALETGHWTPARLASAKRKLLDRSDVLRADIARELRKYDADQYGVLADNVADSAEQSVADLLVDVDLAEIDRDVAEVRDVEAALARIARGTYGVCVDCATPIDPVRLDHTPQAARCLPCQQEFEGRERTDRHLKL